MNNKNVKSAKQVLTEKFGTEFEAAVDRLSESEAKKLRKLVNKPGLKIGISRAKLQPRVQINNDFMDVSLTSDLTEIDTVYINGTRFDALDTSYAGLDEILNGYAESNLTVSKLGRVVTNQRVSDERVVEICNYNFEPAINHMNPFLERIMEECNIDPNVAMYDPRYGTLEVNKRRIYNLPYVDEKGIFYGINGTRYIPYHIGYFEACGGSRIDRLRHFDPVESAVRGVRLQWNLTLSDVKFKTILDVSRNLPDFDNHPYGEALLEAYKNKVVLQKELLETNSLIKELLGEIDDLGVVKTVMLDKDAKGLIDPYGTPSGENLGAIFYLTKDAKFNSDGTFTKGESVHSTLGDIMNKFGAEKNNFNHHQMSYSALLISTDVVKINVCYAEFALWNSGNAVVMTKSGAQKMQSLHEEDFVDEYGNKKTVQVMKDMQVGDIVIDMHGSKSIVSLIIDPDMDPKIAKEEQLEHAVKFAKDNPHIDMIVSPASLVSRGNFGVNKEGLMGKKYDMIAPDGTVYKDSVVEMNYVILPQTAEYKLKDY